MKSHVPKGWIIAGSAPENYTVSVDKGEVHAKGFSALLKSNGDSDKFGTLMQTFRPTTEFLANRIRLTAWIKTLEVKKWAGLWMRVDGIHDIELGFDNMHDRPIKGTTDWTQYAIVLDIPQTAEHIAFGVLLAGSGNVWIDEMAFEEVGMDIPVTGVVPAASAGPVNLGFDES